MLNQDVHYSLRVSYRSALLNQITIGGVVVPVFASMKQVSSSANLYILINAQSSAGANTKVTVETGTLVQLSLFARGADLTGNEIEDMGAQVLAIIEPYPNYKISINNNFQVMQQQIISDSMLPVSVSNTIAPTYERNIIIQHFVKHNSRSII